MKRESKQRVEKLVFAFILMLGGAIGPGNSWAEATATIADRKEITTAYSQVADIDAFIRNLFEKAQGKGQGKADLVAQDCLSPIINKAGNKKQEAKNAQDKAISGLDHKPEPDLVKAGQGISDLLTLREQYKNMFAEALACLSQDGVKKEMKEEVAKLLNPLITNYGWEELLPQPGPGLEPNPCLSIYRNC